MSSMRCVKMLLTAAQRERLTSSDLTRCAKPCFIYNNLSCPALLCPVRISCIISLYCLFLLFSHLLGPHQVRTETRAWRRGAPHGSLASTVGYSRTGPIPGPMVCSPCHPFNNGITLHSGMVVGLEQNSEPRWA